jgi:hypothetical protein
MVLAEGACRVGGLRTELTNPGVLDATGKKQIEDMPYPDPYSLHVPKASKKIHPVTTHG